MNNNKIIIKLIKIIMLNQKHYKYNNQKYIKLNVCKNNFKETIINFILNVYKK